MASKKPPEVSRSAGNEHRASRDYTYYHVVSGE
jgi:hypothetical protein